MRERPWIEVALSAVIGLLAAGCAGMPSEPALAPQQVSLSPKAGSVGSPPAVLARLPHIEPPVSHAAFNAPAASKTREHVAANAAAPPDVLPPVVDEPAAPNVGENGRPRTIHEALHVDQGGEPIASRPAIDLDLTSALAMAGGQNPQIAFAAARYREAYARYTAARTLWLPSIRAGLSYHHHDGNLQNAAGAVIDVDRSSLQAGMGVQAVGAGTTPTPGVVASFHTSDAIFQPKIALHAAAARQAASRTATNDTLLDTALAYTQLLNAMQTLRIAEQTSENARRLADLTTAFAESGQGSQADADRMQTESIRRRNDVARAEEQVVVASARLAQVLSLDARAAIAPTEPTVVPIDLVSPEMDEADLITTGLTNRPELEEAQYLVCEAVYRYRREKYAPFVPSVLLGVSQSTFGGGLGSDLDDFAGRFDFDAVAFWELRNLGFGEAARRDETRARYDQMRMLQVQTMDRVAREVVEAHAQVQARRRQIALAEQGVQAARDSYDRNVERIREGQGLPIEVLQSLQALDDAQREYLRTIVDYNEAQFRLQRALGWPIQ